jgi:hypothetical protein
VLVDPLCDDIHRGNLTHSKVNDTHLQSGALSMVSWDDSHDFVELFYHARLSGQQRKQRDTERGNPNAKTPPLPPEVLPT